MSRTVYLLCTTQFSVLCTVLGTARCTLMFPTLCNVVFTARCNVVFTARRNVQLGVVYLCIGATLPLMEWLFLSWNSGAAALLDETNLDVYSQTFTILSFTESLLHSSL